MSPLLQRRPPFSCLFRAFPLLAVLGTILFPPPAAHAAIDSPVEADIERYIKSLRAQGVIKGHERTAWLVHDFSTGQQLVSINENTSLQAASMVKPYLALAFFHQVEAGRLIYGPDSRRHMELMIQKSSNTSTNWVMKNTGGPSATAALLRRHYPNLCRHLRLVEYIPSNGRTYQNRLSAGDYGRFLKALWARQLPHSDEILRIMGLPGTNRLYKGAREVPAGTRLYNKTGSTAMCCGDMGILVARGRDGRTYPYLVVGIIESTRRASSYGPWISRRADIIREVSNIVYRGMKKRYPL